MTNPGGQSPHEPSQAGQPPEPPSQAGPLSGPPSQAGPPSQPWAPPGQPYQPYQAWPPPSPPPGQYPPAGQAPPADQVPPAGQAPPAGQFPPTQPYPAAPPPWPPPAGHAHYSLDGLAAALTVLLAASAAANLVAIVTAGGEIATLLLFLPLIPVFLVWFYRARRNADGRGQRQRWGPGWSIGAWFTPFIYYVFPFMIMADVWRANLPEDQRKKPAVLPGFWWGCWLAGTILWEIRYSGRPASGVALALSIAGHVPIAVAAILLIVIVRTITRGPVGREPASAQPGAVPAQPYPGAVAAQPYPGAVAAQPYPGAGYAQPHPGAAPAQPYPQDWVTGYGPAGSQLPPDGGGGRRKGVGAGYALSALAVVVATAAAAALYWLPSTITAAPARTPTAAPVPAVAPTPAASPTVEPLTVDQLRAGDCLQGPPDLNTASTWPDVVTAVPCAKRHIAEVFYSANYWPDATAFPRNSVIFSQAKKECLRAFRAYDGGSYSASQYSYAWLAPQGRQDWDSGDRLLVCVAWLWTSGHPRGQPMYGSIKGSAL
jgi:hypothetical protein